MQQKNPKNLTPEYLMESFNLDRKEMSLVYEQWVKIAKSPFQSI